MKKILLGVLRAFYWISPRYTFVMFDREQPPVEGDTITIGNLTATFLSNETE